MLLIWKIEDETYLNTVSMAGKGELSKNPVVKGVVENCFGFLHPIELVEISYSCT